MNKITLSPRLLAELLAASPEGFFHQSYIDKYTEGPDASAAIIQEAVNEGEIGHEGEYLFDIRRLNAEQVRERSPMFAGTFPSIHADGTPSSSSIDQRMKSRRDRLRQIKDPVLTRLVMAFETSPGYLPREDLITEPGDEGALATLLDMGLLKASDDLIFDPLRLTR